MDWRDLERMIKDERKTGNPIAGLIHSLQLEDNKATLLLCNYLDEDYGEEDNEAADAALTQPATRVQASAAAAHVCIYVCIVHSTDELMLIMRRARCFGLSSNAVPRHGLLLQTTSAI